MLVRYYSYVTIRTKYQQIDFFSMHFAVCLLRCIGRNPQTRSGISTLEYKRVRACVLSVRVYLGHMLGA